MRWSRRPSCRSPSGDRVKTDAKDAIHLARLLRLDEITAVSIPTLEQEAARDLVRAREDCRGDLMRARHRLSKLLLRNGIVYYGGDAWTGKHDTWLRRDALPQLAWPATRLTFENDYEAVRGHLGSTRPPGCGDRGDGRRTPSSPRSYGGWAACAGLAP